MNCFLRLNEDKQFSNVIKPVKRGSESERMNNVFYAVLPIYGALPIYGVLVSGSGNCDGIHRSLRKTRDRANK